MKIVDNEINYFEIIFFVILQTSLILSWYLEKYVNSTNRVMYAKSGVANHEPEKI